MIKTVSYINEPCIKNAHPPYTLVALANGIQRYQRENNRPEIKFMQKNSPGNPISKRNWCKDEGVNTNWNR